MQVSSLCYQDALGLAKKQHLALGPSHTHWSPDAAWFQPTDLFPLSPRVPQWLSSIVPGVGTVAQLVERLLRMYEGMGSIPVAFFFFF